MAVDGLRFTRRIMAASALAKYQPEEWKPGPQIQSEEELAHAAGDLGTTISTWVTGCGLTHFREYLGQHEVVQVHERRRDDSHAEECHHAAGTGISVPRLRQRHGDDRQDSKYTDEEL